MNTKRFIHIAASLLCGWYLIGYIDHGGLNGKMILPAPYVLQRDAPLMSFDNAQQCEGHPGRY